MHATTHAIARLEHDHLVPVVREHPRGREPRGARADDDHGARGFGLRRRRLGGFGERSRRLSLLGFLILLGETGEERVEDGGVGEVLRDDAANDELAIGEVGAELCLDGFADLTLGGGVHVRGAQKSDGALGDELVRDLAVRIRG